MSANKFSERAHFALADTRLRANFRRAMDGLMEKRKAQFPDPVAFENLRTKGAAIRANALAMLPELLEQLDERCTANGIQVHWAKTVAEANSIISTILGRHHARLVIKGKSMVSEEMHLNHHLETEQITAIESDLGEYIIQLAGETPAHIVMPCIHKNRDQIAQLFADNIPDHAYTEDVDTLTAAARRVLRERFASADAGISGVNFAVAETGTLVLIENEGNGRLSTTLPPVHIAVTGIEKVVEKLADIPPLLALLPRSATGQPITTYVNMISSPRKEGEKDGPTEVHLVLLDNGRSKVYADKQLRDTLRCIRCGACMNHCPVYGRVGGHAYDAVYPGPIGKILMPQLDGIDSKGDLAHASTLCGACAEVCPVKIPIPDILVRLREESVTPTGAVAHCHYSGTLERIIWAGWRLLNTSPRLYRLGLWAASRFGNALPSTLPPLKNWTSVRTAPRFAEKSLHDLAMEEGFNNE